jgi:DNA mismatch repair protein MutS
MIYGPYHNIITRLTTTDNLFNGQSSFEVEINELKTILNQSTKNTLVLADELASKTESHSAACITVAAILELLPKSVSFLFTSHIHNIVNLHYITNLPANIFQIYHLAVNYDPETENLIYNRKLLPGSGSSRYGINVAKYLKLPQSFLNKANDVSMFIEQENTDYLNTKSSHFNNKVYLDKCMICDSKENLETHHIQEQKHADKDGFINHMHKNVKSNLLVLCEKCHRKLTLEKKELEVLQTINGHIVKYKI